jgi:predicted nucleic acid-binding protein
VKVFLDTSVILSACSSQRSLSRLVFVLAPEQGWHLVSAHYCRAETLRNLGKFPPSAMQTWLEWQDTIEWTPNALTTRHPLLPIASKDKPVLISALAAECDTLLTLDKGDFGDLLESKVYKMLVTTPRGFLVRAGLD